MKKYGTIGEILVKNINRVNIICTLEILNSDLKLAYPVIKGNPMNGRI